MKSEMGKRERVCWLVGGGLALLCVIILPDVWMRVEIATIKAEAWIEVAREIGRAIAGLGG